MTEPTAEEALEWLNTRKYDVEYFDGSWDVIMWIDGVPKRLGSGPTPLEAICNAMKGESDD